MTRTDPDYAALTSSTACSAGRWAGCSATCARRRATPTASAAASPRPQYRGSWTASTSVRTEVTEPALTDLLAEIAELRDKPVPANELADAKRAIVAQLRAVARESAAGARLLHRQLARTGCRPTTGTRIRRGSAPSPRRRRRPRRKKYWDPVRLQIVAVGDATKITDILRKKGDARGVRRRRASR